MSGKNIRLLWILGAYLLVTAISFLLVYSRFDEVGIAFVAVVILFSILFSWRVPKQTSLFFFVESSFKTELFTVLFTFILIFATRLGGYWLTRGLLEKAGMIVLSFMLITFYERAKFIDFGLSLRYLGRQILWSVSSILGVWLTYTFVAVFYPIFIGLSVSSYTFKPVSLSVSALLPLAMFLVFNFAEEIFFRGFVQTRLKRFSLTGAILIQAVLFGLYHLNYVIGSGVSIIDFSGYIFFTFLFGIFMGILFELTGSVIVTTFVHASMNYLFAYLNFSPVAVLSNESLYRSGFSYGITLAILIIISGLFLWRKNRRVT